ncbi:MAG TPA: SLC13 family permease [Pyrinomonadaceae bacterium]|nr:SLC13 family permease [Pyrinomonadaceae bacterium]
MESIRSISASRSTKRGRRRPASHEGYEAVSLFSPTLQRNSYAGALPLGVAMQKTGTANLIASWLHKFVGGWPDRVILLALFAVVAVITQFMSDAATTVLFAPVALALAQAL